MDFDEQFFSFVVDAAPDGMIIADRDGIIVFTNRQACLLFGYERDELIGLCVDDLLPDGSRAAHGAHRRHYETKPKVRSMGLDLQLAGRRRDGEEFPVEISLSPLTSDNEFLVVAAVRDITARIESDERLRQSELALLESRQILAVADDRERIARELHDTVMQRLFAAGLSLQATAGRVDPEVRDRIETIVEDLDQTIRDVRTAVFSLQTSRPTERGLRGLLLDVTSEAHDALGFEPRVQFDGPVETIDAAISDQLIPVLREALANVAKHAKADQVRVSITVNDSVELVVTDNGVGVPESVFGGNGLANLAARAEVLGGSFALTAREAGGSILTWSVPRID